MSETYYAAMHRYRNPDDRRAHFEAERETHAFNGLVYICLPTCTEGWHGGRHAPPLTLPDIARYWAMNPAVEMPGGAV